MMKNSIPMFSGLILGTIMLLVGGIAPPSLHAQFGLELRGGAAIGNHAPAAAGLETIPGPSYSATLLARVLPRTSIYATFARSEFGCEEGFCTGRDVTVTSTGWGGGFRLQPISWLWLQGGALRFVTEVASMDGAATQAGVIGGEAGAGLSLPIAGTVRLIPGVFVRTGLEADERTTLVAGELGVSVALPGG